jgi:hypothetical protein
MANVVRDPRQHPEAILPDLSTNPFKQFERADVALVYGSLWKQRYFTKEGNDYFVQPAQWDVANRVWRKYFVENGTDWWASFYPPDNMKRPTGPLCDGCHSVGYDVQTHAVVECRRQRAVSHVRGRDAEEDGRVPDPQPLYVMPREQGHGLGQSSHARLGGPVAVASLTVSRRDRDD